MATFTQTITSNANSRQWTSPAGGTASNQFGCGSYNGTYHFDGSVLFTSVAVAKAEVIVSATLSITADLVGGSPTTILHGEDADNPSAIINEADGDGRTQTTASSNPGAWTNLVQKDINVKTIVEEITTRAGWASGNNMQFIMNNNGSTTGYFIWATNVATSSSITLTIVTAGGGRNNAMLF
jgi:hypothetical protein